MATVARVNEVLEELLSRLQQRIMAESIVDPIDRIGHEQVG
jgi:hypothetical protein